jgi:hypothetical protein
VFYRLTDAARAHPAYGPLLRVIPKLAGADARKRDLSRIRRLMAIEAQDRVTVTRRGRPMLLHLIGSGPPGAG